LHPTSLAGTGFDCRHPLLKALGDRGLRFLSVGDLALEHEVAQ